MVREPSKPGDHTMPDMVYRSATEGEAHIAWMLYEIAYQLYLMNNNGLPVDQRQP